MNFLSQIFDSMFAPAGANDPDSDSYAASNSSIHLDTHITEINPATGLNMIDCGDGMGGISGIDVGGSPFGFDLSENSHFISPSDSMFNNDCGSTFDHSSSLECGSIFDSGFSSGTSGNFGSGCD
jgi:hypothetical protein